MNTTNFLHEPSPDHPGWYSWDIADRERFNGNALGPLLVRTDGDGRCRLRLMTEKRHANLRDRVHGGVTLALVDVALFAAARTLLASDAAGSVTLVSDQITAAFPLSQISVNLVTAVPVPSAGMGPGALIASLACSTRDNSMSIPGNFTVGGSVMWKLCATLPNVGSTCGVLSVR